MRRWLMRRGPDLGLLGVGLVGLAAIGTALAYSGLDGEPYSPLNHTVSELGERGVSELALLFNVAMVTGGLFIALFMLGIAVRSEDRAGRGLGFIGVAAGITMATVGLFPADDLEPHVAVAVAAFLIILAIGTWFAVWVFRGSAPYPRSLGWFAVWIIVAVVAFLVLPRLLQPEYDLVMDFDAATPRPDVWLMSLLEWVVIASAWVWIALLAWHDRAVRGTGHSASSGASKSKSERSRRQ